MGQPESLRDGKAWGPHHQTAESLIPSSILPLTSLYQMSTLPRSRHEGMWARSRSCDIWEPLKVVIFLVLMYPSVYEGARTYMSMWRPEGNFGYHSSDACLRQCLSLAWNLTKVGEAGQHPGISASHLTGVTVLISPTWLSAWALGIERRTPCL